MKGYLASVAGRAIAPTAAVPAVPTASPLAAFDQRLHLEAGQAQVEGGLGAFDSAGMGLDEVQPTGLLAEGGLVGAPAPRGAFQAESVLEPVLATAAPASGAQLHAQAHEQRSASVRPDLGQAVARIAAPPALPGTIPRAAASSVPARHVPPQAVRPGWIDAAPPPSALEPLTAAAVPGRGPVLPARSGEHLSPPQVHLEFETPERSQGSGAAFVAAPLTSAPLLEPAHPAVARTQDYATALQQALSSVRDWMTKPAPAPATPAAHASALAMDDAAQTNAAVRAAPQLVIGRVTVQVVAPPKPRPVEREARRAPFRHEPLPRASEHAPRLAFGMRQR